MNFGRVFPTESYFEVETYLRANGKAIPHPSRRCSSSKMGFLHLFLPNPAKSWCPSPKASQPQLKRVVGTRHAGKKPERCGCLCLVTVSHRQPQDRRGRANCLLTHQQKKKTPRRVQQLNKKPFVSLLRKSHPVHTQRAGRRTRCNFHRSIPAGGLAICAILLR